MTLCSHGNGVCRDYDLSKLHFTGEWVGAMNTVIFTA